MLSAHAGLDSTDDFLSRRNKLFKVLNFTEVGGRIVLTEKTFHRFTDW